MRKNDLLVIAVTAVVVLAATVAVCVSMSGAFADGEKPQPGAAVPVLQAGGVALSLTAEKGVYAAGEKPVLLLTAANKDGTAAELAVDLRMTGVTVTRDWAVSRVARPAPATLSMNWSHVQRISLGPNEIKTARIETGTPLGGGSAVSFIIGVGGKTILAASVSVPGDGLTNVQSQASDRQAAQQLR